MLNLQSAAENLLVVMSEQSGSPKGKRHTRDPFQHGLRYFYALSS
jgi:hypothetical protein